MATKSVRFRIDKCDDRRTLASIFADNGYKVVIEKKEDEVLLWEYYVVVEVR